MHLINDKAKNIEISGNVVGKQYLRKLVAMFLEKLGKVGQITRQLLGLLVGLLELLRNLSSAIHKQL